MSKISLSIIDDLTLNTENLKVVVYLLALISEDTCCCEQRDIHIFRNTTAANGFLWECLYEIAKGYDGLLQKLVNETRW